MVFQAFGFLAVLVSVLHQDAIISWSRAGGKKAKHFPTKSIRARASWQLSLKSPAEATEAAVHGN